MRAKEIIEAETPKQYLRRTGVGRSKWQVHRRTPNEVVLHTADYQARLGLTVDQPANCIYAEFYGEGRGIRRTTFPGTDFDAVLGAARDWALSKLV